LGADPLALKEQLATREWWEQERRFFRVLASRAVESELVAGEYPGQQEALAKVRRLPYLPYDPAVRDVEAKLLNAKVIPLTVPGDAVQLAFAIVHRVDYLMSWNRAHLVSEETQGRLARFWAAFGMRTPLVVSPKSIPRSLLGESIRRRD
jgi:predicted nucleic acid-binding protein